MLIMNILIYVIVYNIIIYNCCVKYTTNMFIYYYSHFIDGETEVQRSEIVFHNTPAELEHGMNCPGKVGKWTGSEVNSCRPHPVLLGTSMWEMAFKCLNNTSENREQ